MARNSDPVQAKNRGLMRDCSNRAGRGIISRAAVQAKRAANAVARQLRGAAAILTGRLFDDRGNHMGPTHANKLGVRYRYNVSQAILQNRKVEAGSSTSLCS
jgi:hypothetical protein